MGVRDVDTACLELAGSFLIDHPYADTPENRADLARWIQSAIEMWLEDHPPPDCEPLRGAG